MLAISSTEAIISRPASSAVVSFTARVTERILFVSSSRLVTSSIAGSITVRPPPGATGDSALRTLPMLSGLSGVIRNRCGSGLNSPSSPYASGFFRRCSA